MAKKRKKKESLPKGATHKRNEGIKDWQPKFKLSFFGCSILGLILVLVVFLRFIQSDIFLFSDIGSDSLNVQYPSYIFEKEKSASLADAYNFYQGMGNDAGKIAPQPLFDKVLRSPLEIVNLVKLGLGAVLGSNSAPRSIGLEYLWSVWLTLIAMWGFVYTRTRNGVIATIAGLSFGLSGYVILGSTWWHSGLVFALLLFAVEQWVTNRRWYFIPFAIYLLYFYTYWFAGSFALVYGLLRVWELQSWKKSGWMRFLVISASAVLLGFMLSAPEIEQSFGTIINSPRGEGMFGSKTVTEGAAKYENELKAAPLLSLEEGDHYATAILRTYSPDMLGNGSNFRGWGNYLEAPSFYVGLLILLLIPQLFWLGSKRMKIALGGLLALSFLLVVFPKFRYAFYFFTGDYYKQALNYLIPITLVLAGSGALSAILTKKQVNLKVLVGSLVGLLIILFLPHSSVSEGIITDLRRFAAVMLLLSAGSLFLWQRLGFGIKGTLILIAVLAIDLGYNGWHMMNEREAVPAEYFTNRIGYNDFTVEAIEYIEQQQDPKSDFYRVEKNYSSSPSMHSSLNDALVFGYRGTQSYSSFNQIYYIRFLQQFGIIPSDNEFATRWAPGVKNTPFLHGLAHVDYTLMAARFQINNNILRRMQENGIPGQVLQTLANRGQSRIMNEVDFRAYLNRFIGQNNYQSYGLQILQLAVVSFPNYQGPSYEPIGTVEDVTILKNRYSMPLGSTYDKYLPKSEFDQLEVLQKQIAAYYAIILEDSSQTALPKLDVSELPGNYTWDMHGAVVANRAAGAMNIKTNNDTWSAFSGTISANQPTVVYFGIPYSEKWEARIDGNRGQIHLAHAGMMCLELEPGKHEVSMSYLGRKKSSSQTWAWAGLILYALGGVAEVVFKRKKVASSSEKESS